METLYRAPVLSNDPRDSMGHELGIPNIRVLQSMSMSLHWKSAEDKNLRRESE